MRKAFSLSQFHRNLKIFILVEWPSNPFPIKTKLPNISRCCNMVFHIFEPRLIIVGVCFLSIYFFLFKLFIERDKEPFHRNKKTFAWNDNPVFLQINSY